MDSSNDSEDETNRMDEEVVSTAASTSGRNRRGPRKTHPIWDFFVYENGRSRCSICSYQSKGAYPTTLMNHLASKHRKQHQEVANRKAKDDGDRDQKKRKKNGKQQRINFPVQAALKYAKDSSHKRMIDEHLALFAGCTSFAYHLVECTEFKEFVLALNPRYELPCRETLKKFVAQVAREIKENIKELMKNSGKVAICIDIWTQRNMVASYLAITAHFYCYKTGKLENVCLAVKQMTTTHSAGAVKAITDEILAEFDLSDDRISRFRADNGSNIVAAFRESLIEVSAKLIDNDFVGPTLAEIDPNLDESFDEFAEFDQLATEFERSFPKLLDCVAHSLQLPLRKIINNDADLAAVRQEVFALLSKFSKSERATRSLREKCRLKLVLPGLTRWNSLCLTYDRLMAIRESVDQVCIERGWATLGETYRKIDVLRDLLRPFLDFTNFLQGEQYPTMSSIIPTLLNLLMDLESPEPMDRWSLLGDVPTLLAQEIRRRFAHVIGFQERETGFDSTYLIATFLDPNVSFLLSRIEQVLAKRELLIMLYKPIMHEEEIRPESSIPSTPLGSRFARLARVATVTQMMDQVTQPPKPTDDEVEAYMKTFSTKAPPSPLDLVEFWKAQEKEYPELSRLAFDLLAIPATSAAVERVFSQAGLATGGRKCQTGPILLEIECLMKYNKKYVLRLK